MKETCYYCGDEFSAVYGTNTIPCCVSPKCLEAFDRDIAIALLDIDLEDLDEV